MEKRIQKSDVINFIQGTAKMHWELRDNNEDTACAEHCGYLNSIAENLQLGTITTVEALNEYESLEGCRLEDSI